MDDLIYKLKAVRLSGMTQKLNIRIQEATANELSYLDFLNNLIEDELTVRKDRLLNRRLKQAQFPYLKTMDEFDFAFNPSINKQQLKKLAPAAFVAHQQNILMIGPPGVGKTHLAVALGIEAIHKGFSVSYRSIFDIATEIVKNQINLMDTLLKPPLLIIDELGMKQLTHTAN